MTKTPFSWVQSIIDRSRGEQRQYEAFLVGYVHGHQDEEAGGGFDGEKDLEKRADDLFLRYLGGRDE